MSSRAAADAAAAPAVAVRDLVKRFGPVTAVDGVSFTVAESSVTALLGPNGAGKTTLIRVLTGYLLPDSGTVRVAGVDVLADPLEARRRIGYLPENNPLPLELPVDDFLRFAAGARGLRGAAARDAVHRVVERVGLAEVWRKPIGACSKGYRQRVGLAQALLGEPELLFLDEPTNGLDPLQVVEMRKLVRELGSEHTVLLTSHVLPEVAALAERALLVHRGRLVADQDLAAAEDAEATLEGLFLDLMREEVVAS